MDLETLQEMEEIFLQKLLEIKDDTADEQTLKEVELIGKQIDLFQKTAIDTHDKNEKRRVDEEVRKAQVEVESSKSKLTAGRVIFELSKVLLPTALSIGAYAYFQKILLQFEETGRLTSSASRGLNLPKFWK